MLKTIIPTIELEYIKKLSNIKRKVFLDNKNGHKMNFIDVAKYLVNLGADTIQIIETSEPTNIQLIKNTFPYLKIIGGGGINSIKKANNFLKAGSNYIIIGRHFISYPNALPKFNKLFGQKLIISIEDKCLDSKKNYQIKKELFNYVKILSTLNVKNILYVAEAYRLLNKGIFIKNFIKIRKMLDNQTIVYAGGLTSLSDVIKLKQIGANGIIIGTALYKHNFSLKEAIDVFIKKR